MTKVVWTQEEDSKSLMDRDRRKEAIKAKLHRLDGCITRTKKDQEGRFSPLAVEKIYKKSKLFIWRQELSVYQCFVDTRLCSFSLKITFYVFVQGVAKLMKSYSGNPSFSTQKNLDDTEQQLDEVSFAVRTHSARRWSLRGWRSWRCILSPAVFSQAGPPRGHALQALGNAGWTERDDDQVLSPLQGQHCEMEGQGENTSGLESTGVLRRLTRNNREMFRKKEEGN